MITYIPVAGAGGTAADPLNGAVCTVTDYPQPSVREKIMNSTYCSVKLLKLCPEM